MLFQLLIWGWLYLQEFAEKLNGFVRLIGKPLGEAPLKPDASGVSGFGGQRDEHNVPLGTVK